MRKRNMIINFLLAFFLFSVGFSCFCSLIFQSILKGIVLGCMGGLLFSVLCSSFIMVQAYKMRKMRRDLLAEHRIIFDDGANRNTKAGSIGGWIFLLEEIFYFIPHSLNVNTEECRIPYSQIKEVKKGKKFRSIELILSNGQVEQFVVNNKEKWIGKIRSQIDKTGCW